MKKMFEDAVSARRVLQRCISELRWWLRGVGVEEYRQLCKRCDRTGQAHWDCRGCWRFKR